jgi:hypothetical protein
MATLARLALAAALLLAAPAGEAMSGAGRRCASDEVRPADLAWLIRAIRVSGFRKIGCTGSAFVVDTGGRGRSGHDLYVWMTRSRRVPHYSPRRTRIAGVVVQHDRIRAVWRAGERNVWVEAGPTTPSLVRLVRLRALVRATLKSS